MTEKTAKLLAFPGSSVEEAESAKPRERAIEDFSRELAALLSKAINKDRVPLPEVTHMLQLNLHSIMFEDMAACRHYTDEVGE